MISFLISILIISPGKYSTISVFFFFGFFCQKLFYKTELLRKKKLPYKKLFKITTPPVSHKFFMLSDITFGHIMIVDLKFQRLFTMGILRKI